MPAKSKAIRIRREIYARPICAAPFFPQEEPSHCLIAGTPLTAFHINGSIGQEHHALRLQHGPLKAGGAGVERRLCTPEAIHNPVAGNGTVLTACQGKAHRPGTPGHSRKTCHLPVGSHTSRRNPAHHIVDRLIYRAAQRSRISYRSVRRAARIGSCRRTSSSRLSSKSA